MRNITTNKRRRKIVKRQQQCKPTNPIPSFCSAQVFYSSNGAREAFVELCKSKYVQQVTFDSYLYKKVQGNNPLDDLKLLGTTIGCLIKGYSMAKPDKQFSNPVESMKRL